MCWVRDDNSRLWQAQSTNTHLQLTHRATVSPGPTSHGASAPQGPGAVVSSGGIGPQGALGLMGHDSSWSCQQAREGPSSKGEWGGPHPWPHKVDSVRPKPE